MSHLHITVDGDTVMDGDTGEWTTNPPELVTDQLKANAKPKPWMRALLLTIAEAAMSGQGARVDVQTRATGWTLSVDNGT